MGSYIVPAEDRLNFFKHGHIEKNNLFPVPPLFSLIREATGTSWKEMYQVFNMGHRMELYVPAEISGEIISCAETYGIDARIVGLVSQTGGPRLTIHAPEGRVDYD